MVFYIGVVRILSGKLKGRRLDYPRSGLRPTKGVTRQAIFNILGQRLSNARVCDLFAGAGAMGMEAVSRGAKGVVFVEKSPLLCGYLRENVAGVNGVKVIKGDVRRVVPKLAEGGFDVVFADPPYNQGLVQKTVELVFKYRLLVRDGILIIEHCRNELPLAPEGSRIIRQERYGESMVTFLGEVQDENSGLSGQF
ncbi:MAG: 16S rRNA (guanine(966)-N(2))-methyltransferase RsmD [bacterium]